MISENLPHWMRELARLSVSKSQLYLYGNIKDTVLYPIGTASEDWTLGPLREAMFEYLRQQGGYEIIAAYNIIDGMVFADAREGNQMSQLFDELVVQGEKGDVPATKGKRAPQPVKAKDPVDIAIQQMRYCLTNRNYPCTFIIEHGSQLIMSLTSLSQCERQSFLRLLKASADSPLVAVGEPGNRRILQNLMLVVCDKLTDLPAWLYLNNPFTGSIEIETPKTTERQHFFNLFLPANQDADDPAQPRFDPDDLSDLTEGMTVRELCGIRALARTRGNHQLNAKTLVDAFKYGGKESEWDALDWERLTHAEESLSKRVIGQPAAVAAVADVLRRARLHLSGAQHSSRTKPRGVLFFAGPTGVGKTELAKDIAEMIFGTEEACVRFDMSEFSLAHADQRLLGAPPGYIGYEEGGQLTNRMKSNPFCVLLFDEIEKAHASVLDKFLQILEDGRMTDGHGETVYFAESIIIFTSNIGIYQLDPQTGRPQVDMLTGKPLLHVDPNVDIEYSTVKAKILEGVQAYFKHILGRPELLNRIGQNIVVFDYVRPPVMRQILERKVLRSIQTQVRERWKLQVDFAPEVIDQLIEIGKGDVASGGRGMGNLAETAVLNPLARAMFTILSEHESLEGKSLLVTGIIPPQSVNDYRYEISWHEQ
jgi:hypothetical protein